jgi:hypothetical protein
VQVRINVASVVSIELIAVVEPGECKGFSAQGIFDAYQAIAGAGAQVGDGFVQVPYL